MSKIKLVIATEFKTRAMKKSFILLTLLMPILFAAVVFLPVLLSETGKEMQEIAIVDNDGRFSDIWQDSEEYDIDMSITPEIGDSAQALCLDGTYSAVMIINPTQSPDSIPSDLVSLTLFSSKTLPSSVVKYIENNISDNITEDRLNKITSKEILAQIEGAECNIKAQTIKCSEDGNIEEGAEAEVAVVIGMVATMLIYMFIFISGAQVMNAVMQEKTNRIVEVMLSAIKPWELMWGKLIAVALVSLTQMLIWAIFTIALVVGAGLIMASSSPEVGAAMTDAAMQQSGSMQLPAELSMLSGIDWGFILSWFLIYFIAGYLLYAAMFAAMGAAVENETDAQQFMLPVTAIVLFALYAGIFSAENPDGALAFWCSMVPFTSPIVMMVRLPFGVAWWELALSMTILIGSIFGMAWICSKIYRVGILMYGKKASWKELWKWLKY